VEFALKKYLPDYAYLLTFAGAIVAADQWSKFMVRTHLAFGDIWSPWPWLIPYARIVHWNNTGAAFGMLQSFGNVFTVLAFLVSLVILYYFPQIPRQDWVLRLALGLQLGGAIGNLISRLTVGTVTDFISIGNFAVFNIADASISVGVAILILGMWLKEREQKPPQGSSSADLPTGAQETAPTSFPGEVKRE
jgi:signal peptidase II